MLHWLHPHCLWLLCSLPLFVAWQWWLERRRRGLPYSSLQQIKDKPQGLWVRLLSWHRYGYIVALALAILGLAGPRQIMDRYPVWDKGIDLVFVMDLSESMAATDLPPSRIQTAKSLLLRLLRQKRQRNDRFGLVIFASKAFTLCPLTVDHKMLEKMLQDTTAGQIGGQTAMGDAIATALARLRHHPKRRRAILLITDGETNAGRIHPLRAAIRSRKMKIPIHSILIGRDGVGSSQPGSAKPPKSGRPGPPSTSHAAAATPWGALQQIARLSRGRAYRIASTQVLQRRFQEILQNMLPTRTRKPRYFAVYRDRYPWLIWPALAWLGVLLLLQLTRLREIP